MKTLLVSLFFLCSLTVPAFAAAPGDLPPGTPDGLPVSIDYLNKKAVPLNAKEQRALNLTRQWTKTDIAPVLSGGGKIVYTHGAVLPSIIGSPMQVCDVELEPGERVNEIIVGDSARWMIETGSSGFGGNETVHLFIKPVDAGLESMAVVTTDRRVYHLRLISQRKGHTPYIGFLYADNLKRSLLTQQEKQQRQERWNSTDMSGDHGDLSRLNFDYTVKGDKVRWMPERVFDDGRQTFIRLPSEAATGEMPVLLVRKGRKDVLVNYRVQNRTVIVDGLFDRMNLVIGVGGDQEKVEIRRKG